MNICILGIYCHNVMLFMSLNNFIKPRWVWY
ncbi:hypothetical protein T11_8973 [Trichinella zimbabwensis]|uniref:Uncharacterized protein n=1 Tax=Trichinella zimbabwensis TaxID=268475 RepID=A0A0V1F5M9_9BILA|nr:hypothetical protein T11_8973 [Trichinella zimbabwensis]